MLASAHTTQKRKPKGQKKQKTKNKRNSATLSGAEATTTVFTFLRNRWKTTDKGFFSLANLQVFSVTVFKSRPRRVVDVGEVARIIINGQQQFLQDIQLKVVQVERSVSWFVFWAQSNTRDYIWAEGDFHKQIYSWKDHKAEVRPEEKSKNTEICRENLRNEIQLKGPQTEK